MTAILKEKTIISPFHYSNYEFQTENSADIEDVYIQYAESVLNRSKTQLDINNIINNIDFAIKIELSIFEYTLIYCINNGYGEQFIKSIYDDKTINIIANLDENNTKINNKTLLKNILNGTINLAYIAFMSPSQLHPAKWNYWVKKKEYKEWREDSIAYSDAYKCFKCGESKCKISQAQTRSADEPMTTFVTCLVCRNTFKFS